MTVSVQLRALGGYWRIQAALIDAFISGCITIEEALAHPLVSTAILVEEIAALRQRIIAALDRGDSQEAERIAAEGLVGWHISSNERLMARRGWANGNSIYDAAQIPEKHRRVIDLVLMRAGDPDKNRKGYFSLREIANITGHPLRTVQEWAHDDMAKLKRLDWEEVA